MNLYICWLTILFQTNFDKDKLKRPVENAENTETIPSKIAKTVSVYFLLTFNS